jgi:hypothetical protein
MTAGSSGVAVGAAVAVLVAGVASSTMGGLAEAIERHASSGFEARGTDSAGGG